MRPLALFSISGAVVWAGLSVAVVTQDPDIAILAPDDCPGATAWRAAVADDDFDVEATTAQAIADHRAQARLPERLAGCQAARVGGYLVEGPVPPAAISALLQDHPRDVSAVAMDDGAVVALRLDGSLVPLAEAIDD